MKGSEPALLFTCEHGGNHVPGPYRYLFRHGGKLLDSHRGYDKGALDIARVLSETFRSPLVFSITTRLLIDLNRSLHHPKVFSELTLPCDVVTKEAIIKQYYLPYREQIETIINGLVGMNRPVLHFSIHSFTPRLGKVVRKADLGLLYDPSRNLEKGYARQLQRILKTGSNYVIRLNYPYRGKADGLTTALRKRYPAGQYSGMEIEINQKWLGSRGRSPAITGLLCAAIRELSDYKP